MKRAIRSLPALIILLLLLVSCANDSFGIEDVPEFSGSLFAEINGNVPFFTEEEITSTSYESYSEHDELGRCGVAVACLGFDLMPTEERDFSLTTVTPSGWTYKNVSNNRYYESFDGYLYHRSHLIGFQLAGESTNDKNLITGTSYFNVKGMLPFENMVADYIEETRMHVMYRVTPIYYRYELVARGVLMEALSVEDGGEGISFCVFVYNVQPGIEINYFNGVSRVSGDSYVDLDEPVGYMESFVLNVKSKRYHLPECVYAENIKKENRVDFKGRLSDVKNGYPDFVPCSACLDDE